MAQRSTWKFREQPVTGGLEDASAMLSQQGIDDIAPQRTKTVECPGLISAEQPRVADHVDYQNSSQAERHLSHAHASICKTSFRGAYGVRALETINGRLTLRDHGRSAEILQTV
jgi:hypothetical protein